MDVLIDGVRYIPAEVGPESAAAAHEAWLVLWGYKNASKAGVTHDEIMTADAYAAANPLGGPATLFETIARRLRAGEDYQTVMDDYAIRFDTGERK